MSQSRSGILMLIANSKTTELDEDDYLRNPAPQNEHVGVGEEAMHLETLPQVVNYPIEAQNRGDESEDDSGSA